MIYLTETDILRAASISEMLDVIEISMNMYEKKEFHMPQRLHINQDENTLLLMVNLLFIHATQERKNAQYCQRVESYGFFKVRRSEHGKHVFDSEFCQTGWKTGNKYNKHCGDLFSVIFKASHPVRPVTRLTPACRCPGTTGVIQSMPLKRPQFFQSDFPGREIQKKPVHKTIMSV